MSKKAQTSGYFQTAPRRFSRHQNKKVKKQQEEKDQKQLLEYIVKPEAQFLQLIYNSQQDEFPGHFKLGIWRKNLSLLTRSHLPLYVKLLDYAQLNQSVLFPSKAHINPKKNNKTDILIQDPVTQKTRLIKMQTFPILLSPLTLIFYKFSLPQFEKAFQSADISQQDLKKVFNYLVEQLQNPFTDNQHVLWPSVIMEGLNYKFEQIQSIISNFKVSNTQSIPLFHNILRVINQGDNLNLNESQIKPSIGQQEQVINQSALNEQHGASMINSSELKEPHGNYQQKLMQQQQKIEKNQKPQNKFCIWLIGTSFFAFTNDNIVNWNEMSAQVIKILFSSPIYSGLIKQTNSLIDSLNKHKKLQQAELKADQYKFFLYRLGTYKTEEQGQNLCIPLRFQYVKGAGKRILIKILRKNNNQLKWVPTETTTINYTLPNISRKQMSYLYLSKKLSTLDIITSFFYRQFLYLPQRQTSQIFKIFYPQFYTNQEQAYKQRCKSCNYLIRDMPFKCCFFCLSFCHEECTGQIRKKCINNFTEQLFSDFQENSWICNICQPCTICSQAVGQDYLFCSTCYTYSHFQCGRIKGLQNQSKMQHLKINDKYICQFCLKCKMCSHKLKDSQYLIMDNQFYCSQCSDKIKSNNHCHVCMKKKQGNSSMKWIQCGNNLCEKWVHQICDPEYIGVVKCPTAADQYLCPFCRISEKRKIYVEIINNLSVFDQAQFFTQPTYKTIPFYDTIISEPMCFAVMKQKALAGQYDDNPLKRLYADFQLIVSNALRFNMPKQLAHVQAKILKILGEKTIQKYKPLFNPQLKSLICGSTFEQINNLKLQLHRQINNHYPQILLNYGAEKSLIQIKQTKKKVNQLKPQDQIKFSSTFILNNLFRNSTIIFHLKKQKIGINNLFTMPKSQNQRGIWHSIKRDLCYYHDNSDIIYSCNQCCQSYCCIKECLRHRLCTLCGQKGCKCDNYQCGCLPLKEKDRKIIQTKLLRYVQPTRTTKQALMDLTQNFKYCLKCAQDKITTRICHACNSLCAWGYFRCPDCSRVWHKKCYPYSLSTSYVGNSSIALSRCQNFQQTVNASTCLINQTSYIRPSVQSNRQQTQICPLIYCKDCLSTNHLNSYQQSLTLQSKARLIKISKITRYMRIFIQVYFNQGIRLTPYQIQQLILDNYDQFSIRQQLFKQFQLNYSIIERFRNFSFKTNATIERSCSQYLNDYLQIKKPIHLQNSCDLKKGLDLSAQNNKGLDLFGQNNASQRSTKWMDKGSFMDRCQRIWQNYYKFNFEHNMHTLSLEDKFSKYYVESVTEMRQNLILQAYTYKDFNCFILQKMQQKKNILSSQQYIKCLYTNQTQMKDDIHPQQLQYQNFLTTKQYKNYLQSLSYITSLQESYYKKQHKYRYNLIYLPRSMPFEYRVVPILKKKSNLQTATRQFLLGIYEQNKYCLRKGSTCLLRQENGHKDNKDYWKVLKKWSKGKKQILITLQKRSDRWYLKIDNYHQKIVHQIEQITSQIINRYPQIKINSFKELGQFLGFTIFEPFYKANHFTNFLQTNLIDQMPLLQKMNRISQLYSSFSWKENGIFVKPGPAIPTNSLINDPAAPPKIIDYQYCMNKVKPLYLTKKPKKNLDKAPKKVEKRISNAQIQSTSNQIESSTRKQSFVTFQDLKRYLLDYSVANPVKLDISLKNNSISYQVFIAPSKIHKLGLFSRKFIKKHTIIIQYVGQIVSQSVADLRQKRFHYGCYLFGILKQFNKQNQDKKDIIDATFRGNMARYLNHSCDPNCKAKTQYINGLPRIIIYTIRDIQQFQQITYDYQFNVDAVQKLQCTCGAKNCQGRLN